MISVSWKEQRKCESFHFQNLPCRFHRRDAVSSSEGNICVTKLHSVCTSHFTVTVNQLKPQALENTDERTLELQWLFTITHRNTHEWNRTLNLYKLSVFHRSYKLMTLTKSSWFRPPYYNRCWRACSRLVASCVLAGSCYSRAICKQWCWLSLELGVFSNLPLVTLYSTTYLQHHIHDHFSQQRLDLCPTRSAV